MGILGKENEIPDIPRKTTFFSLTTLGLDIPRFITTEQTKLAKEFWSFCAVPWPQPPQQIHPLGVMDVPSARGPTHADVSP